MKKLQLKLEDLRVDSFTAADEATLDVGTVRAHAKSDPFLTCAGGTCNAPTCGATECNISACIASCGETCRITCGDRCFSEVVHCD